MRRVAAPILMLGAFGLALVCYGCTAPADRAFPATATAVPSPTVGHRANPSPTTPQLPSPSIGSGIPPTGQQAPDFALPSGSGEVVALSSYVGQKNAVLLFYRTGG
jgi:hypothetical protein